MSDEREILSPAQAIEMLPDGDTIHTFRSCRMVAIGADWTREDVLQAINAPGAVVELAGPVATSIGHGLVVWTGDDALFVETRPADMDREEAQR